MRDKRYRMKRNFISLFVAAGAPRPPHDSRENPTRRQVEQEVIKVNPSIESMDGRG